MKGCPIPQTLNVSSAMRRWFVFQLHNSLIIVMMLMKLDWIVFYILVSGGTGEWSTLASTSLSLLWPPSAQVSFFTNNVFFMLNFCRDCVQTFAMASGVEHFKCPNCNNKELIAKVFQKIGIYVPQKVYFWKIW